MKPSITSNISKENQLVLKSMSDFLKNYRVFSGLTQEQVSEYAELNRSSVIRLEKGYPVSFLTILKICSILELPLYELFSQENE